MQSPDNLAYQWLCFCYVVMAYAFFPFWTSVRAANVNGISKYSLQDAEVLAFWNQTWSSSAVSMAFVAHFMWNSISMSYL